MRVEYPAVITPQETGGYLVEFPDLEEAFTEGETLEEALFNAAEVLTLMLECRLDDKEKIPQPSKIKKKNVYWIAPDVKVQAAILVKQNRQDKSMAELARMLGTSWPSVQRLENPHHSPTLKVLDKAATALGKKLVLSFEDTGLT